MADSSPPPPPPSSQGNRPSSTPKKATMTNGVNSSSPSTLGASSSSSSSKLTPALRSDINAALLAGGQIERIQAHLLTTLSQTSWPSSVRHLCLSLLRSGEVTNYAQLVGRVREEVRKGADGAWDVGVPGRVVEDGVGVVRDALGEVLELEG